MKKVVKLQSCDGVSIEVDEDVVSMCSTVKNMLRGKTCFRNSLGGQFSIDGSYVILKKEGRILASLMKNSDDEAIVSLPDITASILEKVIEYCKFHSQTNCSEREKKAWDFEFIQVKQSVLCELASASYYLDIKPLVNLTSRAIATHLSGKTSEEIRQTFCNINYEVYAPIFASNLATRSRLQRKINKKRQEEKESTKVTAQKEEICDKRSLDDLISFIEDGSSNKSSKSSKKKSKKKKKKSKQNKNNEKSSKKEPKLDNETQDKFVDDPEMAEIDREVEEFRQRLESVNKQNRYSPKLQLPISAASFVSSLVGVH